MLVPCLRIDGGIVLYSFDEVLSGHVFEGLAPEVCDMIFVINCLTNPQNML